MKSREFVQSDESSSEEDTNKSGKLRHSDDSNVARSSEPVKIGGSDSSTAEDVIRQTDSDDDRFLYFYLFGITDYIIDNLQTNVEWD